MSRRCAPRVLRNSRSAWDPAQDLAIAGRPSPGVNARGQLVAARRPHAAFLERMNRAKPVPGVLLNCPPARRLVIRALVSAAEFGLRYLVLCHAGLTWRTRPGRYPRSAPFAQVSGWTRAIDPELVTTRRRVRVVGGSWPQECGG